MRSGLLTEADCSIEKAALLLALTGSRDEEEFVKQIIRSHEIICGVTEVSGVVEEMKKKVINAVVGASLNLKIIEKKKRELHGLVHATVEACFGIKLDVPVSGSFFVKMSICRKDNWVCVAIYGETGIHISTSHKIVSLGCMHL